MNDSSARTQNPRIEVQKKFQPPFCANGECYYHTEPPLFRFFQYFGWYEIDRYPHWHRRFRCKRCRKSFSFSYFKLDYYQKRFGLNHQIFNFTLSGLSKRATGRMLGTSECLIRNRVQKMARWAMLRHAQWVGKIKIHEPLVYDGLENFAYSQFDPNHINHMIGKDSLFTYDFGYAPLNRKGRMSETQAKKKTFLEEKFGAYPSKAIRTNTKLVFLRAYEKKNTKELIIHSDQHFQYKRVVERDLSGYEIQHMTTPSKAARNFQNDLFAVNHMDLLVRQHLAAFRRETIAFAKNFFSMIDQYVLHMVWKNTMSPKFTKPHKKDPSANRKSPAMNLGLLKKRLKFYELFNYRRTLQQVRLSNEWKSFYRRSHHYSRVKVVPYAGI